MSSYSQRDIRDVLTGEAPYDDLDERGQAMVWADWNEQMAERRASLDFAAEFTKEVRPWSETDEQGSVVLRGSRKA
ncbi:hypothetical protein ACWF5H_12735 [Arthrobacter sp. NPDC055138]